MEEGNNRAYLDMKLLRFTTAGSVDDGKSTLIGRLLYDSKAIFQDQLDSIELSSKLRGEEHMNLALLTDGLRAEREQGITIDVAYRYFATPKRKFIIADTPGHIQYTRNMVTGASTANLAIILIDVRNGVIEQTLRHSYIASLLQIPHLIVCINKMDLANYDEKMYAGVKKQFMSFSAKLGSKDIRFVPISALKGDNIVNRSEYMNWYQGPTLMHLLENIYIGGDENLIDPRFPVQYVIRPQTAEHHDYRSYAGRVAGGIFKKGDEIVVLPTGMEAKIKTIDFFDKELELAFAPQSVAFCLTNDIEISRGYMLVKKNNMPHTGQDIEMMVCWFNEKQLVLGGKYAIKHTTNDARCLIKEIIFKLDVNTLERNFDDNTVKMNDIARLKIRTTIPLHYDSYRKNRITGSVILIDEGTNETVGAGMIV
ncbi:sulfate adenylyltransferase subunit 1 [Bacteroidota bacterium]